MDNSKGRVREIEIQKAVNKAVKELIKSIEQEPSLIIESGESIEITEQTLDGIRAWLFKRRVVDGHSSN